MAKSLRFQALEKGGPTEIASAPRPSIASDEEIQIQIRAVGLQPLDYKMIDFGLRVEKWPCVPGMNGAGVVTEIGKQVTRFKVGDEVLGVFIPGNDRTAAFQVGPGL